MAEQNKIGNIREAFSLTDIDLSQPIPTDETRRQYYFMAKAVKHVSDLADKLGHKPTCCVTTFGCQMNARDSEKLVGILELVGYELIDDENADFVIYNSNSSKETPNTFAKATISMSVTNRFPLSIL